MVHDALKDVKNIKVLLVDDDQDDYLIIQRIFAQIPDTPFEVEWVDNFEAGKTIIEQSRHDVYLIDYLLGARTGLDLLGEIEPEKRSQPFIILTGAGNEDIEWRSIQLAAADYLVKGSFDANLLSRTLYYALQRKKVEDQRVQHLMDLNRSKDEFISIASHQLRTPATGVKQYVGMLLEGFAGTLTDQQIALLKKAYESNERQLRIVSDLLKVAQVDAGKVMLHKKPVDIGSLVRDVVRDQAEIVIDRNQTIECQLPKKNVIVSVDEASIRMVLDNVLDNASKYSEEDTHIKVVVSNSKADVTISVVDQGIGINPEEKTRLFEKFSRLDNSLSAKVGGSGLGLYWARKIIDLHGGKISYKGNEGPGTTFDIKLPKNAKV